MKDVHVIESLPILTLCLQNRCDCRCVMCDIWKLGSSQQLDIAELQRHVDDLGVRWVVFSGGEPMMHADIFRLAGFLRERGMRITILSTGLLLARNAGAVARDVDDVIVSLDGPPQIHDRIRRVRGAFDLLADGVRAVHALNPEFHIAARTTVQRLNFRFLRQTVDAAMRMGLSSLSFLAADVTSAAFNHSSGMPADRQAQVALTEAEVDELQGEIEGLIGELPCYQGFVLETPEKLRRIARHFRAHLGLTEPVAPKCNAPWVSALVEADGTVRPCFFHKAIGNAKRQPLREILNGNAALEFRRTLDVSSNPVCRRCVCSLFFNP